MATRVVKALVPTAMAAALLSKEFPQADLDMDGTLFTVVIYGATYSEALTRIRAWMSRSRVGPILVTDDETTEELLTDVRPGTSRRGLAAKAVRRDPTV